jgi:hypothetical protein
MHIPALPYAQAEKLEQKRKTKTKKICIITYHRRCVLGGGAVCMKKRGHQLWRQGGS